MSLGRNLRQQSFCVTFVAEKKWWLDPGSNRGHTDFQSALFMPHTVPYAHILAHTVNSSLSEMAHIAHIDHTDLSKICPKQGRLFGKNYFGGLPLANPPFGSCPDMGQSLASES